MDKKILSLLKEIAGPEYVITDTYKLIPYHTDALGIYPPFYDWQTGEPLGKAGLASAVVRCGCAEEVSEILKLANKMNLKIRVRGNGTGVNGNRPRKGEIILDLSRMNWIKIHEEDCYAEVGPTVIPLKLNEVLEKRGYILPVYPGGYRVCSLGGMVSINTSGHSVDPYLGKPENYVLGLQVVLPTGEIIETGTKVMRKPSGPDFTRIFIGGEGLFGVITNLWIRLKPKPLEEKRAQVIFPSIFDAMRAVQEIFRKRLPYPNWLEMMDEKYTREGFQFMGMDDPQGACLQIVTDGDVPGEAAAKLKKILETCKKAKKIMVVDDPKEWDRYKKMREVVWKVGKRPGRGPSIDPPISKVVEVLKEIYELPKRVKTVSEDKLRPYFYVFGHAGGMTLHNHLCVPEGADPETHFKLMREWNNLSHEIILKYGGSWGEQGIFPENARWWIKQYGSKCYELLKRVKRVFDPNDVLNPTNLPEDV